MIFDTPEGIDYFVLCSRKAALKMEIIGLKRRGRSAYSICKSEYGLKGNKQAVFDQMEALVKAQQ